MPARAGRLASQPADVFDPGENYRCSSGRWNREVKRRPGLNARLVSEVKSDEEWEARAHGPAVLCCSPIVAGAGLREPHSTFVEPHAARGTRDRRIRGQPAVAVDTHVN